MAQQSVTVGNEMKLSKGKLKPNNRSKFLENEISPSQTTSRLESQPGTAELQGGYFSVSKHRARLSRAASTAPRGLQDPAQAQSCLSTALPAAPQDWLYH